jgi:hypothetical protein
MQFYKLPSPFHLRVWPVHFPSLSADCISASLPGAVIIVTIPKIDACNPVADSAGIARTHHVDAVPAKLGFDA